GELCEASCTRDAECPSGLTCVSVGGAPGRCLLPALQEGRYGAACADDATCGADGLCARLEPEGEGACRCFTPCTPPPEEPPGPPAPERDTGGCASVPGLLLWGLLTWVGLFRPGRRQGREC
ncbi:MAG TPA: polyhydroxyalkanoate biosynthesis repressor PhaR, partial [Myxococcus sp.]|nr:polyhydroxyalkanoate biosynthesis repressor PhaR [Myxococcus sp.]